jgi:hypothetical protein
MQGDQVLLAWLPEPFRVGSFISLPTGTYEIMHADATKRVTEQQLHAMGVKFFGAKKL